MGRRSFGSVHREMKSVADNRARSSRALRVSREPVNTGTLQDRGAMQRCLASLYYFHGKSGVNKKEDVSVWCR